MPYIDKPGREEMAPLLDPLMEDIQGWTDGGLNYAITRLVCAWLGSKPTYSLYNRAIGVLECAKLELYRRAVSVYEDEKRRDNGEVYPRTFLEYRKPGLEFRET